MADLKEKNQGQDLNVGETDYRQKFDERMSQPDMQALDDQLDTVARENTGESERKNPDETAKALSSAEQEAGSDTPAEAPTEQGLSEQSQQKGDKKGWSRRRKILTSVGAGGSVAAIIGGFMALLPLKVPGIMSMATDKAMARVEQVTEKRAKLILGRAILSKFGTHTGIVLTGDGAFSTLVASMRTNGFEKRLAEKGLVIKQTDGGVKLLQNGRPLGGGKTLKNEQAILDALEKDNVSNKVLKTLVKEDIPSWRWIKRAKFAKWLRIKYAIPRYGLPDSDEKDPDKKAKELDAERAKRVTARTNANFSDLIGCIITGHCDAIDGSNDPTKTDNASDTKTDVDAAGKELEEDVLKNGLGRGDAAKSLSKILISKISTAAGSKAIPIVGWVDLVASLDHFAHAAGDNDYIGKISAYYKGAAYAGVFGDWSGFSSQIELAAMDPNYVGHLASELDGAETAQTYQVISGGDASKGVPIETPVNSDKPSNSKQLYDKIMNSPVGFGNKYLGHPVLNAYYETVGSGGILGWLGEGLGGILSKVTGPVFDLIKALTPDQVKDAIVDIVVKTAPYVLQAFGMTINALDQGAGLMNNILGGATVSANEYGKSIGLHKLSPEQAYYQDTSIAAEHNTELKDKGILYALFSTDEPTSAVNQLAVSMPSSFDGGIASLASLITNTPSRLASFILPQTHAAGNQTLESLFGVSPYGATAADLNQPLSSEFINGESCPEVPAGSYDSCNVDTEIASAMNCEFDSESTECADTDSGSSTEFTGEGSQFRIASFNIYYSSDEGRQVYSIQQWQERLRRSSDVIKNNHFDVVGLQEVRENQWQRFQDNDRLGASYDIFPKRYAGYGAQSPIVWNREKFDLVEGKLIPGYQVKGPFNAEANTQVHLKDKSTGQDIYVINVHEPVGNDTIRERYESAKFRQHYVQELQKGGYPIFITGDFNSSYTLRPQQRTWQDNRNNMIYCILTEDNLMWDAYDAAHNQPGHCPNTKEQGGVDHIFMSTSVQATKYDYSITPRGNGSDVHKTLFADVVIPSSGDGSGGDVAGWSWPVDKRWWKSNRADFLGPHPMYSSTFTSPSIFGAAADIGDPPDGSPVFSMLTGKVVKTNLCGSGDGMIIESNTPNGKLQIAYGHGTNPRFHVGDSVNSGDQILNLGAVGCKVSGGHLHVDMSLEGRHICPQDVFLAMGAGTNPNLMELAKKGQAPCGRL